MECPENYGKMYPIDSRNQKLPIFVPPYYNDLAANMNMNSNLPPYYDVTTSNFSVPITSYPLGGIPSPVASYMSNIMSVNNVSSALSNNSIEFSSAPQQYNMIRDYCNNNNQIVMQNLNDMENCKMYNDFSSVKSPYLINNGERIEGVEMPQFLPGPMKVEDIDYWRADATNTVNENDYTNLMNQKTITKSKNTNCSFSKQSNNDNKVVEKRGSSEELNGACLVQLAKKKNLNTNKNQTDTSIAETGGYTDYVDSNNSNADISSLNQVKHNLLQNDNCAPMQFSSSFMQNNQQMQALMSMQNNSYFSSHSILPTALSFSLPTQSYPLPTQQFAPLPVASIPHPLSSSFISDSRCINSFNSPSFYQYSQNPYAVDYTPLAAHQLVITLDRLEDIPKAYEGFDSCNFFVAAYIHEEDENKEKMKTKSFVSSPGKSRSFVNCDLQKSMIKISWIGEEFLKIKIMEENEFRSDVLGCIELHIETLQQRTLLRVPIIGECNEHKGYLIFSVNISPNISTTVKSSLTNLCDHSHNGLIKSYNSLIKTKTKKRTEADNGIFVNFFSKWCCDLPAIDLN